VTPESVSDVDALQSEQGTRFLRKLNRNVMVTADIDDAELPPHLRWAPAHELMMAIHADHAINTDARSVLVTTPWGLLTTGGEPFSDPEDPWREALRASYGVVRPGAVEDAKERIIKLRVGDEPEVVDLRSLPGWSVDVGGPVTVQGGDFVVRQIRVETNAREVAHWDQPIVDTIDPIHVDVHVSVEDGMAYLDLAPSVEAGLIHRAEWTASSIRTVGKGPDPLGGQGTILAEVSQSDEGGRFYRDVAQYRLIRIDRPEPEPGHVRLTLGELQPLLAEGGWLTNEVRSAMSLLLRWL
jgi:oxidase EvaA